MRNLEKRTWLELKTRASLAQRIILEGFEMEVPENLCKSGASSAIKLAKTTSGESRLSEHMRQSIQEVLDIEHAIHTKFGDLKPVS